jgi:hypothetical protein
MFFFLPAFNVGVMECECCGKDAGTAVEIGWLVWSLLIHFGGEVHP